MTWLLRTHSGEFLAISTGFERIMLTDIGSSIANGIGIGNGTSGHNVGNGHGNNILVGGFHSLSGSSSGIGSTSSEKLATRNDEASSKKGNNGEGDADEDDDDDDDDEDEDETTVYMYTRVDFV